MKTLKPFFRELSAVWSRSRTPRLAAALAYYSLFSLAPTLFIALSIANLFIADVTFSSQIYDQITPVLGEDTVGLLQSAVESIANRSAGTQPLVTVVSIAALIFAATGLFAALQDSLNTVWEVPPATENVIWQIVRGRLLAFLLVLAAGLVFFIATVINLFVSYLLSTIPVNLSLNAINYGLFFLLVVLSIAVLYKILPDIRVRWRDVWIGATVSGVMILVGSRLLGFYLSISNIGSAFEAAGTLAVLLVGVYYMTQMFLFGAIVTRVYSQFFGSMRPTPAKEKEES